MSDFQKLWLQKSHNDIAIGRARQVMQAQGRALPCRVVSINGAIVTVEFQMDTSPWTLPPVTIPKAESPWVRMATQVGDFGLTMPADVYLGGISGLGGGTASFTRRGNLTALVFVPVSNSDSPPDDVNASQICGPNGAILRTTEGTKSSVVTNQDGTTITFGDMTIKINAAGVTITAPTITLNGAVFQNNPDGDGEGIAVFAARIKTPDTILPNGNVNTHIHPGVETGDGDTGIMTGGDGGAEQ